MPVIEKLCELLVNLIQLGIAKISIKVSVLQKDINKNLESQEGGFTNAIGFNIYSDEDSEDDCEE